MLPLVSFEAQTAEEQDACSQKIGPCEMDYLRSGTSWLARTVKKLYCFFHWYSCRCGQPRRRRRSSATPPHCAPGSARNNNNNNNRINRARCPNALQTMKPVRRPAATLSPVSEEISTSPAGDATFLEKFRYHVHEFIHIIAVRWDDYDLADLVQDFFKTMMGDAPYQTATGDFKMRNANLSIPRNLADLLKELRNGRFPDSVAKVQDRFNDFYNQIELNVYDHFSEHRTWQRATVWVEVTLGNGNKLAIGTGKVEMPCTWDGYMEEFILHIDPNDHYVYTMVPIYRKSWAKVERRHYITLYAKTGLRRAVLDNLSLGPEEPCEVKPLTVNLEVVWRGPNEAYRRTYGLKDARATRAKETRERHENEGHSVSAAMA